MDNHTPKKTDWRAVIVFYVIACAFSWPFFYWRDILTESWVTSTVPAALRNLGVMWGPGVAALCCFFIFRKTHVRTITFTGTSVYGSLAFYFLPYLAWFVINLVNPSEKLPPSMFLMLIPFGFLMILGEELGWRGFLQDALRPLSEVKRWIVIGLMWEMWHFTRGMVDGNLAQILMRKTIMLVSVLLLTFIIGRLTDKTRSLVVAITLHSWVNIQFEFAHINTHIAGIVSLLIWTVLIMRWRRATGEADLTDIPVAAENSSL